MPENFDKNKINIVIYGTSEDEMEAIGEEWAITLYKNQNEGIRQIRDSVTLLRDSDRFHIYLRMHPNLAEIKNESIAEQFSMGNKCLTVIPPSSKVSSYLLLDNSDVVITFGSTMGIEATYWGKPSVQITPALYNYLNATYRPSSHSELMEMLTSNKLQPLEKLGALKFGYYMNTYGIRREISKMKNFIELESVRGVVFKERFIDKIQIQAIFYYKVLCVYNSPLSIIRRKFRDLLTVGE